jgi:dihydroorotase
MAALLLHHAQILLPSGDFLLGDMLVSEGKISQIAEHIKAPDDSTEVIDATGLTLLPGVIDP